MNTSDTVEAPAVLSVSSTVRPRHLCWGAILAGLVAAMALEVLFVMLGAALGFAVFTPLTDVHPLNDLAAGAVVVEGVSAVVSLWFGGWVAGRLTPAGLLSTAWVHGFVVWSAATVAGVLVVASGAGSAISGLGKAVGGGLNLVAQPAAMAAGHAGDGARDALQRSKNELSSFVDEANAGQGNAVNAAPGAQASSAPSTPTAASIRAKRDLTLALGRMFEPSQSGSMADNKAAVSRVLVEDEGMSQADADKMVNEWAASYQQLQAEITEAKNQAEAKARQEAEEASNTLAIYSFCAFSAFVIGAVTASLGARTGCRIARRYDGVVLA